MDQEGERESGEATLDLDGREIRERGKWNRKMGKNRLSGGEPGGGDMGDAEGLGHQRKREIDVPRARRHW